MWHGKKVEYSNKQVGREAYETKQVRYFRVVKNVLFRRFLTSHIPNCILEHGSKHTGVFQNHCRTQNQGKMRENAKKSGTNW